MASNEAANYDQPTSKEKTESKVVSDIRIGGGNKSQETGEANYNEQNKKQLIERMQQNISSEVIE